MKENKKGFVFSIVVQVFLITLLGCNQKSADVVKTYDEESNVCERLSYIRNNTIVFLEEDSLIESRLIQLSKETKMTFSIPKIQHYGNEVSLKSQADLLNKQVVSIMDSLCLK